MTTWNDDENGGTIWSEDESGGRHVSAYIETLLDDTSASAAQTTLGISAFAKTLLDDATSTAARTTLEVPDYSTSGGSALVGFLQSGTGATARTLQAKAREIVSVTDFGAVADSGTTDNQVAFTNAVASIVPQGGYVYVPPSSSAYDVGSSVAIPSFCGFIGGGYHASIVTATAIGVTPFTAASATEGCSLRNLEIIGPGATSTAPGVKITNSAIFYLDNVKIRLFNVGFQALPGVNSSYSGTINRCEIISNNTINIDLQSRSNNWNINDTTFGGGPAEKGIRFTDSDTLKVSGGDCEGVSACAIDIDGLAGAQHVGAIIAGVHFEGNKSSLGADINLGATNTVFGIKIAGCYFAGDSTAGALRPINFNKVTGANDGGNTSISGTYAGGADTPLYGTVAGITVLGNDGWSDKIVAYDSNGLTLTGGPLNVTAGATGQTVSSFTAFDTDSAILALFKRSDAAVSSRIHYNSSDGTISFGTSTAHPVALFANNTEYLRITSAGAVTMAASAQTTTLGGPITTSAPTGGAGAWEFGIANSVSPTSPNRTLTVEIGGTVYYIAAKTTND